MAAAMDHERLARLKAELVAIDKWDKGCGRDSTQDTIDEVSIKRGS
jgi:hypothetical protein